MNIKLENEDVRIRLTEKEYDNLLAGYGLRADFKIGGLMQFSVGIEKKSLDKSSVIEQPERVQIELCESDFQKLKDPQFKKKGVVVGPYNLQVDLFKQKV